MSAKTPPATDVAIIEAEVVVDDDLAIVDVGEMIATMAELARAQGDSPEPLAAGTFALYPMVDGGMMFVTDVREGVMAGVKRQRIPPGLMRAMSVLMSGGSRRGALKALLFKPKGEIGS
jgi:hypothetical protein